MTFLRNLWAREPVLVGTLLPLLVTAGVITADQAGAINSVIAGVVSAVVVLVGAFSARSQVKPVRGSPFSGGH